MGEHGVAGEKRELLENVFGSRGTAGILDTMRRMALECSTNSSTLAAR